MRTRKRSRIPQARSDVDKNGPCTLPQPRTRHFPAIEFALWLALVIALFFLAGALTLLFVYSGISNLPGDWSHVPASIQNILLPGAALGLACIVLTGLGIFLILRRKNLAPLKEVEAAVQGWLQGNREPVGLDGTDCGSTELGASVNRLVQRFQRDLDELKGVIEQSQTGILVVDANGTILFANSPAAWLMNRRAAVLLGSQLGLPVVASDKTEIEILRGNGERGVAELSSSRIEWNGEPAHLLTIHDITKRHQAEEATRHQAAHDDLTGLPNRAHFHDSLDKAIQRAATQNQGLAVLFLDLDRFKEVNDTLGHAAGDELLKAIAERLRGAVRSTDLVARMSGDEFTILLDGVNEHETALTVGKKLCSAVSEPMDVAAQTLTPQCTIGFSLYPGDATDAPTLMVRADIAMYHAKTAGRNRVHAFSVDQGQMTTKRFWMEQALQQAQTNGEFRLFYQPEVTLPGGEPVDVEALLRWQHPEEGLISPAEFIPLLEETDLIQSVGEWIFRQAAADVERWDKAGLGPHRVWINVSSRQLASPDLVERIDGLVAETSLNPERFGIELTESGIAGKIEYSLSVVATLQQRGFRIAMDDFGTGYSALTFLRRLALDMVKIDCAFVRDIDEDASALSLVRAIVALGHALDLQVLAEGVERASQADHLAAEGCRYAQGFWFARPMPPDELTEWWRENGQYTAASTKREA